MGSHYYYGHRKRRLSIHSFIIAVAVFSGLGLLLLTLRSVDPPPNDRVFLPKIQLPDDHHHGTGDAIHINIDADAGQAAAAYPTSSVSIETKKKEVDNGERKSCATVEEMGESFNGGDVWKESLRVRSIIHRHFAVNGASRVRDLPPEQFCKHGFVLGKASEAGFGNEMYKILNAAALSIMLNRSLIIGQTRHIGSFSSLSILFPI